MDPYISTDEIDKFHMPFLMLKLGEAVRKLIEKYGEDIELCVLLAGKLTLCYLLRDYLDTNTVGDEFTYVIPNRENKVKEIIREDGTVEKAFVSEFVQYRFLALDDFIRFRYSIYYLIK